MQGKKAIIIFVPVPQLKAYQKIQTRLVRELEKKFSGKPVVFIAQVGNLSFCDSFYAYMLYLELWDVYLVQWLELIQGITLQLAHQELLNITVSLL